MRYLLPLLLLTAACGSSPTGPSQTPPPTPVSYTLSGTVTATNGGQPLAGATIEANGVTATTDGSGHYTLAARTPAPLFTLTGPGVVTRTGTLHGDVDAFGPGFDLGYFRQLARDGYEQPGALQPLARWTNAPQVYLRTVDDAGRAMEARTLDMTESVILATASQFTGGRFGVAGVERGTDTRSGQAGWITVAWLSQPDDACGRSGTAVNGGTIELHYRSSGCGCNGLQMRPRTIKHELGHAMGLSHTGTPGDLMAIPSALCDQDPSLREREYAAYLYRRPVGSTDEDHDPN